MPQNTPLKSVENIVQLESARRAHPGPNVHLARAQPAPPVLFASWVAVRDRAAAALLGGTTRVVITGPAGTGKTVLIEHVARVLRAAGRKISIQLADADPAPPGPGVTLFVDEADRLSPGKLRELLDGSVGSVVLAGLAPLARRVAGGPVQLTLEPLDQNGAADYVAQWLFLNGRNPAELDGAAMRVLIELSGGVPRLLSTLLGAATWLAKGAGSPAITAVHIQEAAELRSVLSPTSPLPSPSPPLPSNDVAAPEPARRGRLLWSGLLAGAVLAGVAGVSAPRLFPAETDRLVAAASPLVDQVERWLRGETTTPRVAPAAAPAPVAVATPIPPPPVAQPEPPPPVVEAQVAAPVPEPVQAAPEPPPSAPAPAPAPPPSPPKPSAPVADVTAKAAPPDLPIETIEFLLRRGRAMLALEDLSAARLLFLRAAEGGSADAMFELGQTYDPVILTSLGAAAQADRAEALRWYRRAAEKGNRAAEQSVSRP